MDITQAMNMMQKMQGPVQDMLKNNINNVGFNWYGEKFHSFSDMIMFLNNTAGIMNANFQIDNDIFYLVFAKSKGK